MEKIDYSSKPYTWMRRSEREVKDETWIKEMLRRAPYGALATSWQGQPFLHTTLFVYSEEAHALYMHGALEGRKRANIEANPSVCFSVSEMGRLLPAETAIGVGVEYAGVVVFGKMTVLEDPEEARRGLQMLLDKYFSQFKPGEDYRPILPEELAKTAVYRLDIEQWSGKLDKAPDDYPGAFRYPDGQSAVGSK